MPYFDENGKMVEEVQTIPVEVEDAVQKRISKVQADIRKSQAAAAAVGR